MAAAMPCRHSATATNSKSRNRLVYVLLARICCTYIKYKKVLYISIYAMYIHTYIYDRTRQNTLYLCVSNTANYYTPFQYVRVVCSWQNLHQIEINVTEVMYLCICMCIVYIRLGCNVFRRVYISFFENLFVGKFTVCIRKTIQLYSYYEQLPSIQRA